MTRSAFVTRGNLAAFCQWIASAVLLAATLAMFGATVAAALGYLPFLTLPLRFGETLLPQAGAAIQVGLVVLLVVILSALPAGFRVLRLERSHRDFALTMSDVAEAYHACHAADRGETFRLGSEYDAVKERIRFLQCHPDLGALEPEILELAAQMSYVSRDLAETYSDENVARARGFLRHRQEEIALFQDRIEAALATARELRRQKDAVETEERVCESRLAMMEQEFGPLLRDLGFVRARRDGNVIALPGVTAAE